MYNNFLTQVENAASIAQFDADFYNKILKPDHIHQVNFSVKLSDGSIQNFDGFRVQHNNLAGPYKGGLRFSKNVELDEVKTLSAWMTIKTSLLNLPLGGGKGGINLDPKSLSFDDKEKILRKFVEKMKNNLGPNIDIPAPDMYTNESLMAVATDEIIKIKGQNHLATFTGKPVIMGGIKGRTEATALGGIMALEEFFNITKDTIKGKKIIIQGFGNAGNQAAKILHEKGALIIATSDSKGGIINQNGLIIDSLISCKSDGKALNSCDININEEGTKQISNEDLLKTECDILILAALENVITESNANDVKAKLIVELANGPITPKADTILKNNEIDVLPDILMNAGGVTVSYFEYSNNLSNRQVDKDEVYSLLQKYMSKAVSKVITQKNKYSCTYREASYIVSLKRLEKLFKIRKQFN